MEVDLQKQQKLQRFTNIILLAAIVLFIFGSGYRLGQYRQKQLLMVDGQPASQRGEGSRVNSQQATTNSKADTTPDLTLFWTVWNSLKTKYVDQHKVDTKKMVFGAIKGMVASIDDPYTFFLTPTENKAAKDDLGGKYEGIGAQLGMQDNVITIVAPLKGSPAEKAGIKSGDKILTIDKVTTEGMTLTTAVAKIRGVHGTKVTLGLLRGTEELTLTLTREQIKVQSVELSYKKAESCSASCRDVAYIKVSQFGDDTMAGWDRAVTEVGKKWESKSISGLVVDMRSNPGGYLESAVYLSSDFIPLGKRVVRQEYADKSGKDYVVERVGNLQTIPTVVLINEGSASAAEIFAGALRDYSRAKIVGMKSFGKGSVQEALDLGSGAGLHVTVAKWILPKGDWINGKGIQPQIKVENKISEGNTITEATDAQLQRALEEFSKN
ncbi:MAG: S41 family peptidase [Patescibacteria group bacterium]|jgi:carboxyl-terminal processing protease